MDWMLFVVPGLWALLVLWETVAPARRQPRVPLWALKGVVSFAALYATSLFAPRLWDAWLAEHRLLDATGLGTWGGAAVGFASMQLFTYCWHRSMHASDFLWRTVHQLHHSAERLDAVGAYWFSPLDMLGWVLLSSLALVWAVGLTPEAAFVAGVSTTFLSLLQHANIRTPRWLGYLVQRPESHSMHHARGVHAGNYGDVPLLDMLLGTYENPREFAPATGFYDGASSRVVDMLLFRDVSRPPAQDGAADGGVRAGEATRMAPAPVHLREFF